MTEAAKKRRRVRVGYCPHCAEIFRVKRASAEDVADGMAPMQTCPRCFSWMGYSECRPWLVDREAFNEGIFF